MKNCAIISSSHTRKALVFIRALGKEGIKVWTLGDSIFSPGFWSKFTSKRFLQDKNSRFSKKLNKVIINKKNINYIYLPMDEEDISWLYVNRSSLPENLQYLIPSEESFKIASFKSLSAKFLQEQDVLIPKTYISKDLEEFQAKIKSLDSQDYLVKPSSGRGSMGIVYGSKFATTNWLKHWQKYGKLLIQERIEGSGDGVGVGLLFDRQSNCVASFVHKRLQQFPNSGGPSTDRVSIIGKDLIEKSKKTLKKLNWQGFVMVEWKFNPKDQKYYVLEINPRTWGSVDLAVKSGVNFPLLYFQVCLGEKIKPIKDYEVGIRSKWSFPGDILRFATQKIEKRESFYKFVLENIKFSEELDIKDIRGSLAAIFCQFLLVFKPQNFKVVLFKLFLRS